jgi:polyisoprenoid-binding protein YceI
MNSEKIPKSTFQGKITGFQVDATGAQQAKATGKLTIHGITKDIDVPGTVEFANGTVIVKSAFIVKLEDYEIMRPQLLWKNIAEQVEVKIEFTYKPI